jgi:quercetin dioxygenase-like cupin family protein
MNLANTLTGLGQQHKERTLMTTQNANSAPFTLASYEGRTPCPLDILGAEVLVKLGNGDASGFAVVFQHEVPAMSGPPLHRHSREDEWFHVLDGEVTFEIDGRRTVLHAGSSAFAPRGTAHTFKNFCDSPANMLVMVTPGAFQQFFEELSALNRGLQEPDLVRTEQLMREYGIDLLGPPLS